MLDKVGQEISKGDYVLLIDGKSQYFGIVLEVTSTTAKCCFGIYREPAITTKRSPDKILRLHPQQVDSFSKLHKNDYSIFNEIETYYAGKSY